MALRPSKRPPRSVRCAQAAFTLSWDGRLIARQAPEEPERIRDLIARGLVHEICVTFRPCILGGKSAPPITGLGGDYLPRGIELDLLNIERIGDDCLARYRIRPSR